MALPQEFFESVVADYPRWPGEAPIHYTERVAILAGAIPRSEAAVVKPDEDIKARKGEAPVERETRMPCKE